MAQKITTTLVDDLTGEPIEDGKGETIRFAIDGANWEIDLTRENAKAMRDALKPYTKAARAVSTRQTRSGGSKSNKQELAAARKWLRANGHEVSDRGRVAGNLMELYRSSK